MAPRKMADMPPPPPKPEAETPLPMPGWTGPRDPRDGMPLATQQDGEQIRMDELVIDDEDPEPPAPPPAAEAAPAAAEAKPPSRKAAKADKAAAPAKAAKADKPDKPAAAVPAPVAAPAPAPAPTPIAAAPAPAVAPAPAKREIVGSAVTASMLLPLYEDKGRKRPPTKNGSQLCIILSPASRRQLDVLKSDIEDEYNGKLGALYRQMKGDRDSRLVKKDKTEITQEPPYVKITQQEIVSFALNKFFTQLGLNPTQEVPEFMK